MNTPFMIVLFLFGQLALADNRPDPAKTAAEDAKQCIDKMAKEGVGPQKIKCDPALDPTKSGPAKDGCAKMAGDFCNKLFDPAKKGNINLGTGSNTYQIRHGENEKGVSNALAEFSKAKLAARPRYPKDFRGALDRSGYFTLLQKFINAKDPDKLVLNGNAKVKAKIEYTRLTDDLAHAWSQAYKETVTTRLKGEGTSHEEARANAKLDQEISEAVWKEHPKWKAVEAAMKNVRAAFLETIGELNVTDDVKKDWKEKISNTKLILPNTEKLKYNYDAGCEGTVANALHFTEYNAVTICAGVFTAQDPTLVLAHEMAHGLDPNTLRDEAMRASTLGVAYKTLRDKTCSDEPLSCEEWEKWKNDLPTKMKELGTGPNYIAEPHLQCLQENRNFPAVDAADLEKASRLAAIKEVDTQATAGNFLLLAKEKLNSDGVEVDNPAFQNPCFLSAPREYADPFKDSVAVVFSNEYRCSKVAPATAKLDQAIAFSRETEASVGVVTTRYGGRFSDDSWMVSQGYSSDIGEVYADNLGVRAFAKIAMKKSPESERRNLFFAGTSLFCEEPALAGASADEREVEKKYSSEPHSLQDRRLREVMIKPLRDALDCDKDFPHGECKL